MLIKTILKRIYKQNSPWDEGKIIPLEIVNSAVDWVDTQIKLRSLMASVKVTPERSQDELKQIFKKIFTKRISVDFILFL